MAKINHIVFLTPGFPHDESETNCLTYFQHFLRVFHTTYPDIRLSVISFHYPYLPIKYQWHGIPVEALGGNNGPIWQKINLWRKVKKRLKTLNKEYSIDLVHALWLQECSWVGYRINKKMNIPLLCTAMGTEVLPQNRYLKLLPLSKMNVVMVSAFQKSKFEETLGSPSNARIITWGLPRLNEEIPTSSENRPFHIMAVGFLNEIKQIPLFLEIVARCKQEIPDFKALLIGRDYSDGRLDRQIEELGLKSNIDKFPLLKNEEIIHLMSQTKILVHTSRFESLGYVFLEALRAGMYIVSRRLGVAQASKQWHIATDKASFTTSVLQGLATFKPEPQLPFPISETVNQYMASYEMAIRRQKA